VGERAKPHISLRLRACCRTWKEPGARSLKAACTGKLAAGGGRPVCYRASLC
jgi:hypothetical protein